CGVSDVWNTADDFRFAYKQVSGDFDVKVLLTGATAPAGVNPMLGLMARETLAANSRNVYLRTYGAAGGAYKLGVRAATGGTTTSAGVGVNSYPNSWIRLVRSGNTFTGYFSTDGLNWSACSSTTLALPSQIYLGMAVCSRNTTAAATGMFRNFGDTAPAPTVPAAPSNLGGTAPSATEVDLNWTDNSNNETGFKVFRKLASDTNYPATPLATVVAGVTTFNDSTAVAGTSYVYQVFATNDAGDSSGSNEFAISTPSASNLFTAADVGAPAVKGSTQTVTAGKDYNVSGAGVNVWGSSDQFQYFYKSETGDFDMKVRVAGASFASATNPLLGIMARSS